MNYVNKLQGKTQPIVYLLSTMVVGMMLFGCDGSILDPLDGQIRHHELVSHLQRLELEESDFEGIDIDRLFESVDLSNVVDVPMNEADAQAGGKHDRRIVRAGESIQAAIDEADPGETILVHPGTYIIDETITIDKSLHLTGVGGPGRVEIRDAGGVQNGIFASNVAGLTLSNLTIRGFSRNGVFLVDVDGFVFHRLITDQLGEGAYGLFPVRSSNGLIAHCTATGADDAGVYVGQSENVAVLRSTAFENVIGFEAENVKQTVWTHNRAYDNAAGMLGILLPPGQYISILHAEQLHVRNNRFENNNHSNFAEPGDLASFVPSGTGLLVFGYKDSILEQNRVSDNDFVGIGLGSSATLWTVAGRNPLNLEAIAPPGSYRVRIRDNRVSNNGTGGPIQIEGFPAPIPAADLFWDAPVLSALQQAIPEFPYPDPGEDNCWSRNTAETSFPSALPGCSEP